MKLSVLFSYLDPGTGSIVAQSVIGALAGVGLFGRKLFTNLAAKLKGLFNTSAKKGQDISE